MKKKKQLKTTTNTAITVCLHRTNSIYHVSCDAHFDQQDYLRQKKK